MIQRSSLRDKVVKLPYRGAPSTVGVIRRAVIDSQNHYQVRELAEHVCQGISAKDYVSEPLAIFYFVCQKTRYMRDPRTVELVRAPHIIVDQILQGSVPSLDCDDMAALICALCMSTGSQTRVTTVAFKNMFFDGNRQYSHVYAEALDPKSKKWVVMDPVAGRKAPEMLKRVVAKKHWPIA